MKISIVKLAVLISFLSASVQATTSAVDIERVIKADVDVVQIEDAVAKYPITELNNKREGNVVLTYEINKNGEPVNIEVVSYRGSKGFIRSAIKALQNSRFESVVYDGQKVNVVGMQRQYVFELEDALPPSRLGLVALNL